MKKDKIKAALFGLCIGDALGVPVEFAPRYLLKEYPVTEMMGYKVHNQPPGTWSDDSSLAFCLAESLVSGYNLHDIAKKFCQWAYEKKWTPHGEVFDIGITTRNAIARLKVGTDPVKAGGKNERNNGNGSLMRILPLAFYLENEKGHDNRFQKIHDVSCLTHRHLRSQIACSIYIQYAINLLKGMELKNAYDMLKEQICSYYSIEKYKEEIKHFHRVLNNDISCLEEKHIQSNGYVVSTLEASLWCLLTSGSYKETVLKAVNLGEDTDTTGAVAGGIAGIFYGYEQIPREWRDRIIKKTEITDLAEKLGKRIYGN